uniref:Uncharacterized protein n=1 Tax=Sphaerodactylus townsendi TaxID=933632 RepID=A0ACB8FV22_9SAUR
MCSGGTVDIDGSQGDHIGAQGLPLRACLFTGFSTGLRFMDKLFGLECITTDVANSLIRCQMDCSSSLASKKVVARGISRLAVRLGQHSTMHGVLQYLLSRQASHLEYGSVDTARAGWFASVIQRKWSLGGDSIDGIPDVMGVALQILMETDLSVLCRTMPKTKLFGRAY